MERVDDVEQLDTLAQVLGLDQANIVPPAHRHLVVGGLRLHVVDWGGRGSPPVVFLHGGALTARTWDAVCLLLRDEYHCIAFDQRGHGDSEWSPSCDYDIDDHLRDLTLLVDELGLERFVLVGQSLGGINALRYASRHSRRVRALVVIDVTPFVRRTPNVERVFEFMLAPPEADSVDEFVERAVYFNPRRDPRLLRKSLMHNLRTLPDGRWTWKYDRRHLSPERFDAMITRFNEVSDELQTIACPTLIVRGSEGVISSDAARLAGRLEAAYVVTIDEAGHNVQGDNPAALVGAMRSFLSTVDAAAP